MAVYPSFDPSNYPPPVSRLLSSDRLCALGPGTSRQEVRGELQALSLEDVFSGQSVADRNAAAACLSGLWLLHDFLDESHTISQSITTPTGSYWHGIMHRREPDYSNAKYWFRRVGEHPVFDELGRVAADLTGPKATSEAARSLQLGTDWDPFAFVDLCQSVGAGRSELDQICRELARAEWELLFDFSYRKALG
jgi:hypothetical protein